jgi:hypothetical protein
MKLWQKLALITLIVVVIGGVRVYFVWKSRQDPGVVARHGDEPKPLSQDELAVMKQFYFANLDQGGILPALLSVYRWACRVRQADRRAAFS